jgi:hypothetical protein
MDRNHTTEEPEVTIRVSTEHGEAVMLAEMNGQAVAAMGLKDGKTVLDPTRATPWILTLLRIRRLETRAIIAVFGA